MGTLSMDNNRTRSVMNRIELIVEPFFRDSEMKRRLLCCFPHYCAAIFILRNKTDFQDHIDEWFADWVHVFGREGCTNYTHMLSSSHVLRYMQEWKCLHRFSQQGWEALNALIKSYFFRRTNRGGLSKPATKKSKLLGIARWLQRRIMWYSGLEDTLIQLDAHEVLDPDKDDDASVLLDDDSSSDDASTSTLIANNSDDEFNSEAD